MMEWKEGEKAATQFLENDGYSILDRNYRDRRGEIDIVARSADTLVFVEVKTWREVPFEELGYSIEGNKMRKIIEESKRFLYEHPRVSGLFVRFDLVFVAPESGEIEHIEDAFTETDAA